MNSISHSGQMEKRGRRRKKNMQSRLFVCSGDHSHKHTLQQQQQQLILVCFETTFFYVCLTVQCIVCTTLSELQFKPHNRLFM